MAGATLYSDGKQYITDNRVWTEDEWNSPEGKAYREQLSKTHADLWLKRKSGRHRPRKSGRGSPPKSARPFNGGSTRPGTQR